MKPICLFFLALVPATFAGDLSAVRKATEHNAELHYVKVLFDQPYAGNDNPKQEVDLYLPKQRERDKPLPVIAHLHGDTGDRLGTPPVAMIYAGSGDYAVVGIGYRHPSEAPWPAQIYDCKAAIRWIRAHAEEFNLDASKIAVVGDSAGGHLASLLGTSGGVQELEGDLGPWTNESSRVQGVVNFGGLEDLTTQLHVDRVGRPIFRGSVVTSLGVTAEEKHAEAVAASPLTYVTPDDPPFLSAQGTKDERVDYANAEAIHAALQKAGASSLLIPITDGGHDSVHHPELQRRARQFLEKHLRGIEQEIRTEPIAAHGKQEAHNEININGLKIGLAGPVWFQNSISAVSLFLCVASLFWIRADASKRGKSPWGALFFALFAGFPFSLLWWLWLRPPPLSHPPSLPQ